MIQRAMLCGHEFDTDSFPGYPDDYAGYCPECIKALEESDDNYDDVDTEPDGNGIPQFDGDSFSEDDDEDYDTDVALDDYEEEENIEDDDIDPMAEETEEDHDRELQRAAQEIVDSVDSVYTSAEVNPVGNDPAVRRVVGLPDVVGMGIYAQHDKPKSTIVLRKGSHADPSLTIGNEFIPEF